MSRASEDLERATMAGANNNMHRALRVAIDIYSGFSTTVQDLAAQMSIVALGDCEESPVFQPAVPRNVHTPDDEPAIERSSSVQYRCDTVPLIAPQPRSSTIWYFPTALTEDALLARERLTSSPSPPYQAESPSEQACAKYLEEGYAMVCQHDDAADLLRSITERMFNVSPVRGDTSINAHSSTVSPLSMPSTIRTPTPHELSRSVILTALVGDSAFRADDVLATRPRAPQIAPMVFDDDLPPDDQEAKE